MSEKTTPNIDPKAAVAAPVPAIDPKTGKPVLASNDVKTGDAFKSADAAKIEANPNQKSKA